MNESKSESKDPICGMTVDKATAIHAERDGKTLYFCSDHCRQKFLATDAAKKTVGAAKDLAKKAGDKAENATKSMRE